MKYIGDCKLTADGDVSKIVKAVFPDIAEADAGAEGKHARKSSKGPEEKKKKQKEGKS